MANQSNLQQLLQNLAGTHTAGQANVPSSVNNGNPNTVYNLPQTPPPTVAPWVNPPANPKWNTMVAPVNKYQLPALAPFVPNTNGGTGWGTPPPTTPPVIPGVPGGPDVHIPPGETGGPNTGGNLPPTTGGNGGPNGGAENNTGSGRGLDWLDLGGDRTLGGVFSPEPSGTHTDLSGSVTDSAGWGGISTNDIQAIAGTSLNLGSAGAALADTALGRSLGITQDGSLSIGQVLDWVIPGNVYMSQTGKFNLLNAIPGILARVNPLLGKLARAAMTWLAKNTNIKPLKNWLARNQENRAPGNGFDGGGGPVGNVGSGGGVIGGSFGSGFDPLAGEGTDWMQMDQNGNPIDFYNIDATGTPRDGWWTSNDAGQAAGTAPNNFIRLRDSRGTGRGYSH